MTVRVESRIFGHYCRLSAMMYTFSVRLHDDNNSEKQYFLIIAGDVQSMTNDGGRRFECSLRNSVTIYFLIHGRKTEAQFAWKKMIRAHLTIAALFREQARTKREMASSRHGRVIRQGGGKKR